MTTTTTDPLKQRLIGVIKNTWGYESFRPQQYEAIRALVQLRRDCVVLMATGAGKSLIYTVPPIALEQTMVVISPLISLMNDQVMALSQAGVPAAALTSGQNDRAVWKAAHQGHLRLVYLSPEMLETWTQPLRDLTAAGRICGFAVDEAHCISEWGHNFRASYRKLGSLRRTFPTVPIMALTATATPAVENDIVKQLDLTNPHIVRTSFNRPNLHYAVRMRKRVNVDLKIDFFAAGGSSIVYCNRKADTEQVAAYLRSCGLSAAAYHAGLPQKRRAEVHSLFVRDDVQIVVATVAFGMGIDKPDVRCIIHYGFCSSIESYFQQTGRAGRDGEKSRCILFYSNQEIRIAEFLLRQENSGGVGGGHFFNSVGGASQADARDASKFAQHSARMLNAMKQYVSSSACRRAALLRYFGEKWDAEQCYHCDNCDMSAKMAVSGDDAANGSSRDVIGSRVLTAEARLFAEAVRNTGERFGMGIPVKVLHGSKAKDMLQYAPSFRVPLSSMKCYGALKHATRPQLMALGRMMEHANVVESYHRSNFMLCRVGPVGRLLLANKEDVLPRMQLSVELRDLGYLSLEDRKIARSAALERSEHRASGAVRAASLVTAPSATKPMTKEERFLKIALVRVRKTIADQFSIAPYSVVSEGTLNAMVRVRPVDEAHLLLVEGWSSHKASRFGKQFIDAVSTFAVDHPNLDVNCKLVDADVDAVRASGDAVIFSSAPLVRDVTAVLAGQKNVVASKKGSSFSRLSVGKNAPAPSPVRVAGGMRSFSVGGEPVAVSFSASPPAQPAAAADGGARASTASALQPRPFSKAEKAIYKAFHEQGLSASDISKCRTITKKKVHTTLARFVSEGYDIDLDRAGVAADTAAAIRQVLDQQPRLKTKYASGRTGAVPSKDRWIDATDLQKCVAEEISVPCIMYILAAFEAEQVARTKAKDEARDAHDLSPANAVCVESSGAAARKHPSFQPVPKRQKLSLGSARQLVGTAVERAFAAASPKTGILYEDIESALCTLLSEASRNPQDGEHLDELKNELTNLQAQGILYTTDGSLYHLL